MGESVLREVLALFPFFISIGMVLSLILYSITLEEEFFTMFFAYFILVSFFLLVNFLEISTIMRIFFGEKENPYLNFILSILTGFYYLPYYILTKFERTGFFRKDIIFLSFFFPLPTFFIWSYLFYSWIVEKP